MREQINDHEAESVAGGTVIISYDYMTVGFSTLDITLPLKNVDYFEASTFAQKLALENKSMTDEEFDGFCMSVFRQKGWI